MNYRYTKKLTGSFEAVEELVRDSLQKEGFGILTEIDVQATLKKKLDVDFDRYTILGACNPPFAHQALMVERGIGVMLPCNVIVYEHDGAISVSAILPTVAMSMIGNEALQSIAQQIESKLIAVIDNLEADKDVVV